MPLPNLPFYSQSTAMNVYRHAVNHTISPNRGYFRFRFISMRLGRDFVFGATLVPTIHAYYSDGTEILGEVVWGPEIEKGNEKNDNRRVFLEARAISPLFPFDGRDIDAQIGLFSIPDKDLISEVLGFLNILTSPFQSPNLIAALGVTEAVRKGVNRLLSIDGAKLVFGWKGSVEGRKVLSQEYIVITPEKGLLSGRLKLVGGQLFRDDKMVENVDYLIFALEVKNHRDDWHRLPEIQPYYEKWNLLRSVFPRQVNEYNEAVGQLLGAIRTSQNIVKFDAERIIKEEILSLLQMGDEIQNPLFVTASLDSTDLKDEVEESLRDFKILDEDVDLGSTSFS